MTAPLGHARVVLFDIDGTLLDTERFILGAYHSALDALDLPVPSDEVLRRMTGDPLDQIYDGFAGARAAEAIELHRAFQSEHIELARPFPRAYDVLQRLREAGPRLAAVTSRSRRTSGPTLAAAGLDRFLEVQVAAEDAPALKPDPAPLRRALELLGLRGKEATAATAYVGDTRADIEAGRALGVPTVAATYGFHGEAVLEAGPDYHIAALAELPALFGIG